MIDPTPDLRTWPHRRERLGIALRWFGLTLLFAPFALTPFLIVATPNPAWTLGDLALQWFALVLMGGLGSLPFFLLVPWFTARMPWFDRSLPGVLALSVLLTIPAGLTPLLFWRGIVSEAPVWIIAFSSIVVPASSRSLCARVRG